MSSTLDQRMRYQQNVANLRIGVVVIEVANTRLTSILPLLQQLRSAIEEVRRGEVVLVR
jgi:hypothetical protein